MALSEFHPLLVVNWLEYLTRHGRSNHTLAAYQRAWDHIEHWYKGVYGEPCDPVRLIGRNIRDWKSYQQSVEKVAPNTINQRLAAISSFYKWAMLQDAGVRNPSIDVTSIRLAPRQPKSLSALELRRLLRAVHNGGLLRDIALIEMLAGTGLRVGELLRLQVGDVILHARSGWVTVREGKQKNYREVPLTKEVRQALASYLISLTNEAGLAKNGGEEAPLWWGKQGPLTNRSSLLRILHKYTMQARLDPIGPHVLRHTFATQYLQANPDDLRGLAALLGHRDLNTVMIYTEPTREMLAKRIERMGQLPLD